MSYTETAKVTSKGQVTIPSPIREILNLEPGIEAGEGRGIIVLQSVA